MRGNNQPLTILCGILIGAGILLLVSSFVPGVYVNFTWPAIFFVLAAVFFVPLAFYPLHSRWWSLAYAPGMALLAMGAIFLYNTLSQDWNAWIYAWMLVVAALGVGLVVAVREGRLDRRLALGGFWAALGGSALFTVLALILGGPVLRGLASLVVIGAGLLLRYRLAHGELPPALLSALDRYDVLPGQAAAPDRASPEGDARVEPGIGAGMQNSGGAWLPDAAKRPAATGRSTGASTGWPAGEPVELLEPLSERELEVLHLIGRGLTNSEIAAELVVAPSTVKTHINNLYAKLGVKTRIQAVNRANELGLL